MSRILEIFHNIFSHCKSFKHMREPKQSYFFKSLTTGGIQFLTQFIFSECLPLLSARLTVPSQTAVWQCHFIILWTAIHVSPLCIWKYILNLNQTCGVKASRSSSAVRAHLVSATAHFYSSPETISTSHSWNENLSWLTSTYCNLLSRIAEGMYSYVHQNGHRKIVLFILR